ncbi:MAG: tail fiber protein, partial [Myxococcota bacterium]
FNFAPRGWAFCDGQLLPISQNQTLYALLGTIYGGDGRTSFALPELRGRTPVHPGNGIVQGQLGGVETVTLTQPQLPAHTHRLQGSPEPADSSEGRGAVVGATERLHYGPPTAPTTLDGRALANTGGGQAHANMQPSIALNFCIALQGLFPSRN